MTRAKIVNQAKVLSKDPFRVAWRKWIEFFWEQCPPAYPVIVRRIHLGNAGHWGICSFDEHARVFRIDIDKRSKRPGCYELLIHEWAHALCWFDDDHELDEDVHHDDAFGRAYARVYRAFSGEY